MKTQPIYVETRIRAGIETIWEYTQIPELHEQWDLRFSKIEYLPREAEAAPQHFLYETRIGFGLAIQGTGVTRGTVEKTNGHRSSSLSFYSEDSKSLIREGNGYWKYEPQEDGVVFKTQFDYTPRFGWLGYWFDRLMFRPLFGFATAYSFDQLRLWLEKGIHPVASTVRAVTHYSCALLLSLLWIYQGLVPKLLYPEAGELVVLQDTLDTLGTLARLPADGFASLSQWDAWFAWLTPSGMQGVEGLLLLGLGLLEIGLGLLTLACHRSKWVYWCQAFLLIVLMVQALAGSPDLWKAPFNPLTLSGAMLGLCGLAGWSSRDLPQASRCLWKLVTK